MKNIIATLLLVAFFVLSLPAQDQKAQIELVDSINFHTNSVGGGVQFIPDLPQLLGLAGAPAPFYEYFWIFGDGSFSQEESPIHYYRDAGTYDAYLLATGNYDKGKKPKKKGKKVTLVASNSSEKEIYPNVIKEKTKNIGIAAARNPSPEEESIIVISYRNNTADYQYGKLHLFFNEKRFPDAHFAYEEALTYFGEEKDQKAVSSILFYPYDKKTALASLVDVFPEKFTEVKPPRLHEIELNEILEEAKNEFHEQHSWSYYNLAPGETRNLFISLGATPEMVKDTSVTIFLQTVLESNDGQLLDQERLEIEIVAAHDPNIMSVSDRKVGFRGIRKKQLTYKVQFQNTGEGPAGTIEITAQIPKGLNVEKLEVLDNYPECPICPDNEVDWSCMDTIIRKNELEFVFRNVYLPGTRQEGVKDRDSTKGFVAYRILPDKKMTKRSFRSQAAIVFDKEEPVITNWAPTRYKFEPSLGVQFGYRYFPDDPNGVAGEADDRPNYYYFGLSLSDYKAFKIYLQPEIRTGISEKWENSIRRPDLVKSDTMTFPGAARFSVFDTISSFSGTSTNQRITLELVPLQFRKNISDFFGVGFGANYRLTFENADENLKTDAKYFVRTYESVIRADGTVDTKLIGEEATGETTGNSSQNSRATIGRVGVFFDVAFGMVRAGPSFGLRNHFRFGDSARYAAEAYLTWKF